MATHFFECLDGLERLGLETAHPAVPEHRRPRLVDGLRWCAVEPSSAPPTVIIVIVVVIDAVEDHVQNRR